MSCPWLQRRTYPCSHCGLRFLHDKMYHHALFLCALRLSANSAHDARTNLKHSMNEDGKCQ